jgi:hypothetical protein
MTFNLHGYLRRENKKCEQNAMSYIRITGEFSALLGIFAVGYAMLLIS